MNTRNFASPAQNLGICSFCLLICVLLGQAGRTSPGKLALAYRFVGTRDGKSEYLVSINGQVFVHTSDTGGVDFFRDRLGRCLRVRVESGRGDYVGMDVDHYYFIGSPGTVKYLGSVRSSWHEQEAMLSCQLGSFHRISKVRTDDKISLR